MDIKQLQTFLCVARLLSFRAAAEELNYSQSTVSDHIRNLEQELDVQLFERLGRKVFLNEHGEKLISSAERMIKDAIELHNLFNNNDIVKGPLKIGAAETLCGFWLPPILKEYSKIYPNVQIILKMADCFELTKMLENNIIDVAFSLRDETGQQQLSQIDLFQDTAIFVAAPDHPLAALIKVTTFEFENQSFILTESESGYNKDFKTILQKLNVKVNTIMEFSSLEAIKQCVISGLGITLLPSITVDKEIHRGELVILPVETDRILLQTKMIYHREKWMSPPLEALKDFVLQKIC